MSEAQEQPDRGHRMTVMATVIFTWSDPLPGSHVESNNSPQRVEEAQRRGFMERFQAPRNFIEMLKNSVRVCRCNP